jgi:hypothetical protein
MKKQLSILLIVSLVLIGLILGHLFYSIPVSAPGPDLPDLTISQDNITLSTTNPVAGEPVIINATIWNEGSADATDAMVNFYEEDVLIGSDVVDIPVNGTWTNQILDSVGAVGYNPSIAIDNENGVHIIYRDGTNSYLKYAYKPIGGTWIFQNLDTSANGKYPSIAIDDFNGVHISYRDGTPNSDLKYGYKPMGGSWEFHVIDSTGVLGEGNSIAVDDLLGIHISYRDETNSDLKYAYKPDGGSWTNYTLDSFDEVGRDTSIALDSQRGVHISYHNSSGGVLKYINKTEGGNWTPIVIDTIGHTSGQSSIAVDDADGIHISYHHYNNYDLKYAYKPSGGVWSTSIVDPLGAVGAYNSIAIDNEKGIHISYRDWTNKDLKYAYKRNNSGWVTYYIDSLGEVGTETDIALDNANGIHICHRDFGNLDLKYARFIEPSGNVQTSIPWTPTIGGLRNITIKIDEDNEIEELDETNNEATISVTVEPGYLWNIKVIPSPITLELNETQQFTAIGTDYFGNEVSISPTWELDGGGIIDQNGLFIAIYPGTWSIRAVQENLNYTTAAIVTIEVNNTADTDSDGMLDWWEIEYNLDPFNGSDANFDPDFDGLTNLQEFLNYSKPHINDTDSDSLGDGFEVIFSKTNASLWDTNANGIGDGLEFIFNQGYLGWMESLPDDWIGMTISWDNYTIFIKTNSSVLEGEFDKIEKKLKIKISGPEGTQGVTEIDISKNLCDPEDIEISLDGELINYTLTEDDNFYHIHIEYNHSVHELSANFKEVAQISDSQIDDKKESSFNLFQLAFLIAFITSILLLIFLIITRNGKQENKVQELPPEKLVILLEKKYADGQVTEETYEDIKSLLEKYNGN